MAYKKLFEDQSSKNLISKLLKDDEVIDAMKSAL